MAKAFKCDCCGRYFDFDWKESNEIVIRHGTPSGIKGLDAPPFVFEEERLELCPRCMEKIRGAILIARGYTNGN